MMGKEVISGRGKGEAGREKGEKEKEKRIGRKNNRTLAERKKEKRRKIK